MVANYMKIVEQLELERMKELDMRANARHAEWEVVDKERQAERAERLATRKTACWSRLLRAAKNLARRETERRAAAPDRRR